MPRLESRDTETVTERPRRTQRDRREATIAKLIEATIASLLEVGYARSSVKEICQRAGVSHGGLFRHFSSMIDLVMAAGEEVANRQIAAAEEGFARASETEEPLITALHVMRDVSRDPINAVFHELMVAARTDPSLHEAFAAFSARYSAAIWQCVSTMKGADRFPPEMLAIAMSSALHLFDGEALSRRVLAFPELEARRMEVLEDLAKRMARAYASGPEARKDGARTKESR